MCVFFFFFSSRRRHTRYWRDWSSDVCSSDLLWAVTLRSHRTHRGQVPSPASASRGSRPDRGPSGPRDRSTHLTAVAARPGGGGKRPRGGSGPPGVGRGAGCWEGGGPPSAGENTSENQSPENI